MVGEAVLGGLVLGFLHSIQLSDLGEICSVLGSSYRIFDLFDISGPDFHRRVLEASCEASPFSRSKEFQGSIISEVFLFPGED